MLYQKNIFIAIAVLAVAGGVWLISRNPVPSADVPVKEPIQSEASATPGKKPAPVISAPKPAATSTPEKTAAVPARIVLVGKTDFSYDIIVGKTPCGDKIGAVEVQSSDPSKELHWGMTGAKPIWLTFSEVEGKTPAKAEMTFNCIMSGAEDTIDWKFLVVEKTKEGKWVDGYYRSFSLKGDIKNQ
ncbi:hypothetical protein HY250_02455 [Candidatus Azambacteria bacterium]|nr:hypothetical protein [Candidatus Azambacteria bacterium]